VPFLAENIMTQLETICVAPATEKTDQPLSMLSAAVSTSQSTCLEPDDRWQEEKP
jgi:hypothetical protein